MKKKQFEYLKHLAEGLAADGNSPELTLMGLYFIQRYWSTGENEWIHLLDYISEILVGKLDHLPEDAILNFKRGGLEVGWLFNTARLLGIDRLYPFPFEETNQFIHGNIIYENCTGMSLDKGALAKGAYLLSCYDLSVAETYGDKFRKVLLFESLVNIVEDIDKLLYSGGCCTGVQLSQADEILYLLLFLSRIIELKIYPEPAKRMVNDIFHQLPTCSGERQISQRVISPNNDFSNSGFFRSTFSFKEVSDFLCFIPVKYALQVGSSGPLSRREEIEKQVNFLTRSVNPGLFINYFHNKEITRSGLLDLKMPVSSQKADCL